MIEIFIFIIFILISNYVINKFHLIPNYSGNIHQTFANDSNIPLSGGIYILTLLIILFFNKIDLIFFFAIIFLIGFIGDKNILTSPKKRLILQIFTVLSFVHFFNLTITDTRVDFIDNLLSYNLITYVFSSFCILILINGSNFIDGLNSLLLGYFVIILYIVFKLDLLNQLGINNKDIDLLFSILIALMLLNYLNFLFLGDSGSYLIGLFLSYVLISSYNLNINSISPYFIIVLIWYPCFENLFSIIRKKISNLSPTDADHKHLHQLIFIFFQDIIKIKKKYLNTITSILINIFNFIIIYFASLNYNNSTYQLGVLIFCISVYLFLYYFLNKKIV